MSKPLSIDLRERIIRHWQGGYSRRQTAKAFMVAPSMVIKLVHLFKTTGTFARKKMGGDRRSKLGDHRDYILRRVAETPDITLVELAEELKARFVTIHPSNLSRFLSANDLTYKKNLGGRRAGTARRSSGAQGVDTRPTADHGARAASPCFY